jgi:CBS domain-containing protein
MLARDIITDYPTVGVETSALEAVRLLASGGRLPGLIVLDEDSRPVTVLPDSQVLRLIVPEYIQESAVLAQVVDEAHADRLCAGLPGKTVGDLLPRKTEILTVGTDCTMMEVAALMARAQTPVVAVVDGDGRMVGAVTVSALFEHALPA